MKDVLFSTGPTKTWSEREKVFFFFLLGGWGGGGVGWRAINSGSGLIP